MRRSGELENFPPIDIVNRRGRSRYIVFRALSPDDLLGDDTPRRERTAEVAHGKWPPQEYVNLL
jgi:hypothetical protein